MSFIVTGLIWQWVLNPTLGVQKVFDDIGLPALLEGGWFDGLRFDWIVDPDMAVYVLAVAGLWHTSGLVMVLMLAGLRGVDVELWKAARVDGIPAWRVYLHIVLPVLRPIVITAVVLLSIAVVKVYDLVLALTGGGPGIATEVPAKFVMDYLFQRANIGLATAASTVMLITVLAVLAPWLYAQHLRPRRRTMRAAH
jgi:glucose/mannose transport system permease protein